MRRSLLLPLALLGALHCNREPEPEPVKRAAGAVVSATPKPAKLELGPLRPLPQVEEAPRPVVLAALKTAGGPGEQLDTDIHSFRVLSFRDCGEAAQGDARLVLG